MQVMQVNDKKNLVQLKSDTDTFWYKVNEADPKQVATVNVLKSGDEVNAKFSIANGVKTLTVLEKVDGSIKTAKADVQVASPNNFDTKAIYTCEKCGKTLKDDTYPTCYTCSMAERAKTTKNKWGKSPEEQNSIRRQAVGHMTSVTVAAMLKNDTNLNVDDVVKLIDKIYDKYDEKTTI
jgi:hypothetical protein